MSADVRELLPLYVLGLLEPDDVAAVERALARDPAMAAELRAYDEAAARLIDQVAPLAPPASVRERLLASAAAGRFERFVERVAQMYDVAVARARELVGMIDDPSTYDRQLPGAALIHFQGGPAYAGADCGFVLLPAGGQFPWHWHEGEEDVLVLQGAMVDGSGKVTRVGEEDHQDPGSEHEFSAAPGDDLIFCARVWGVRFDVQKPK
jgi:hypothetical protein